MRTSRVVHTVSCHAAGEVGDVIVGGVAPPPGATLWEQSRFIATDGELRAFLLNEPRGGVFRHVNLLVPPVDPTADMGFIIMEPEHTPPMSGSNSMCVATVLLETGIIPMSEGLNALRLEAPGGVIDVAAECRDGKAERVTITNVPSFVGELDRYLDVDGYGSLRVDTAFGGDSFVMVDAADIGFAIEPSEAADLASVGNAITRAANEQLSFSHPEKDWSHFSFCQIAGPLSRDESGFAMRNTVVIDPGKLDRSPTGTGVSARMAVLAARGLMGVGEKLTMTSIIGSVFVGAIAELTEIAGQPAIKPTVSGQAWITGTHQHTLDPSDPWPAGYRLSDTW